MSLAEIAYKEAVRSISGQEASFDELRSRATVLFAGGSIAIAVVGAPAIEDGWGLLEVAAVALLGVMGLAVTAIAVPRDDLRFRARAEQLVDEWVDDPEPEDDARMYRSLAIYLSRASEANEPVLDNLMEWYRVGLVAALASFACFGAAIWVG